MFPDSAPRRNTRAAVQYAQVVGAHSAGMRRVCGMYSAGARRQYDCIPQKPGRMHHRTQEAPCSESMVGIPAAITGRHGKELGSPKDTLVSTAQPRA